MHIHVHVHMNHYECPQETKRSPTQRSSPSMIPPLECVPTCTCACTCTYTPSPPPPPLSHTHKEMLLTYWNIFLQLDLVFQRSSAQKQQNTNDVRLASRLSRHISWLTRTKAAGLDQVARANCNHRPAIPHVVPVCFLFALSHKTI